MTGDNIACSDEQLIEKSPAIHSTVDVNDHLLLVDNTIKSNQSSILISATPPEILSPLPVEPEVTVLPVQPEVTVCPLAGYMKDERVLSMQERSNLLTFRGAESAGADGDMRVISCPINPELEICLLVSVCVCAQRAFSPNCKLIFCTNCTCTILTHVAAYLPPCPPRVPRSTNPSAVMSQTPLLRMNTNQLNHVRLCVCVFVCGCVCVGVEV